MVQQVFSMCKALGSILASGKGRKKKKGGEGGEGRPVRCKGLHLLGHHLEGESGGLGLQVTLRYRSNSRPVSNTRDPVSQSCGTNHSVKMNLERFPQETETE